MNGEVSFEEELTWLVDNEPTFFVENKSFVGKVGRTPNGKDIILEIVLPSNYYPFVKPHVLVRTPIKHPNLDDDGILSLQLLEEWTPVYRLKHVIGAARRLFLDSKQLIVEKKPVDKKKVAKEYDTLQNRIEAMEQRVSDTSDEMVNAYNMIGDDELTKEVYNNKKAVSEASILNLIRLIEIKFEDAVIDEIVFFKLYKKYMREFYIITRQEKSNGGHAIEL